MLLPTTFPIAISAFPSAAACRMSVTFFMLPPFFISGQINPAAQRQDMLIELRRLNGQLNEINASLGGTINVDVVRMPAGGAGD